MNDIISAHELMGKVVVVTRLTKIPKCCSKCKYYETIGCRGEKYNLGYCTALHNLSTEKIHISNERLPNCPLRIVGTSIHNNAPLTLDELRQMDGQPVWIVEEPDWGHWELSADAEDYIEDRNPDFYGLKHSDPQGKYGLHKLGWLAYRHPIEEEAI